MCTRALGGEYRAGYDEELAVIFCRHARGDERARFFFRLDDEGRVRDAGHEAVALGERVIRRALIGLEFGKQRTAIFEYLFG